MKIIKNEGVSNEIKVRKDEKSDKNNEH